MALSECQAYAQQHARSVPGLHLGASASGGDSWGWGRLGTRPAGTWDVELPARGCECRLSVWLPPQERQASTEVLPGVAGGNAAAS